MQLIFISFGVIKILLIALFQTVEQFNLYKTADTVFFKYSIKNYLYQRFQTCLTSLRLYLIKSASQR